MERLRLKSAAREAMAHSSQVPPHSPDATFSRNMPPVAPAAARRGPVQDVSRIPVHPPSPAGPRVSSTRSAQGSGSAAPRSSMRRPTDRIHRKKPGNIDDRFEADADREAERVLRMPEPTHGAWKSADCDDGHCECAKCAKKQEEDNITRKTATGVASPLVGSAPPAIGRVLNQHGTALDPGARSFFQPRFGFDFSSVRVHTGEEAHQAAHSIGALAFTSGHHIVFGRDQYSPFTSSGNRLLAHELAHVMQNSGSIQRQGQPHRDAQVACVVRRGGCPRTRDAGLPAAEDIARYNTECRGDTRYTGEDITPTEEECAHPPKEELSLAEEILLGAFIVLGAGAAATLIVVAGEAIIPVVVASATQAATGAWVFYLGNAIAVNEIGLFAAGLFIACEGNVAGLVQAMKDDPAQAISLLAQAYILHVQISVGNGPPRNATVKAKLLPGDEQTEPNNIKFKTIDAPTFEEESAGGTPTPAPTTGTGSNVPPSVQNAAATAAAADQAQFDALKASISNYRTNPKTPGRVDIPASPRVPGDPKAPNIPVEGGTVAVSKTNVSGLEKKVYGGASPGALPPGYKGKPGTSGGETLVPVNPIEKDHGEQVSLNNLHNDLKELLKDATPAQRAALLHGKKVWMLVEQEPCPSCASGIGTQGRPGVIKQFSDLYPELRIEIRNTGRTSGRITIGGGGAPVKKP